jgi:antirestriction protein ArdC
MEGATVVGGFQQWKRMGRMVRKGEKGLAIWFPRMRAAADDGGERRLVAGVSDGEDDDGEKMEMKFMLGTVFDISQTEEVEAERGSK